jgi:CheY-like chemotaxis protein
MEAKPSILVVDDEPEVREMVEETSRGRLGEGGAQRRPLNAGRSPPHGRERARRRADRRNRLEPARDHRHPPRRHNSQRLA